jgi:hypothetical protein
MNSYGKIFNKSIGPDELFTLKLPLICGFVYIKSGKYLCIRRKGG